MSLTRHPMLRFIGLGALLFLAWHLLYEFILKPHTALDEVVATNLADGTTWLLDLFGYEVMDAATCARPHALGIVGGDCLQVGAPCDGVVLFALFVNLHSHRRSFANKEPDDRHCFFICNLSYHKIVLFAFLAPYCRCSKRRSPEKMVYFGHCPNY